MKKNQALAKRMYLLFFALTLFSTSYSQSLNANWHSDLENQLKQFLACEGSAQERTECVHFIGESLNTVYKIDDFHNAKTARYLSTTEIADFVKTNAKWKSLGPAYDQAVLNKAQEAANNKMAVIAVFMNTEGVGHVVLIVPGDLQASGSWGLKAPNSASFFQKDPSKSYVSKSLSFAFARVMMKDITLYVRQY